MFEVLCSSAQIEPDSGKSGCLNTLNLPSFNSESVDMCSFITANRDRVDLHQCNKIEASQIGTAIPTHVILESMDGDGDLIDYVDTSLS